VGLYYLWIKKRGPGCDAEIQKLYGETLIL